MSGRQMFILTLMFILFTIGSMSMFTVKVTEKALLLYLGKVINADYKPGLHFKLPVVHQVKKFDSRIQTVDTTPESFLTNEKKNLIVDSFIKWKIADIVKYYTSTKGDAQTARQRLMEVIADGLRSEFGVRTIQEVVSGDRQMIMKNITDEASKRATEFGIEIIDVRIKRIELPKEVSSSVYQRMQAERQRDAKKLRESGKAEAVRIRAEADRKRVEVVAEAERKAQVLRGEGDAEAAGIYAEAYGKNQEFYALYRSLNAYMESFKDKSDILLIQPNSDFFHYFKQPAK